MLLLVALPVLATVALAHRYLQTYAPSNVLVRRVRSMRARLPTAAGLLALACVLLTAMHVAAEAVAAEAPGWLNLVVLVLAWDAIKVGCLGLAVGARAVGTTRVSLGRQACCRSSATEPNERPRFSRP